MHLGQLLGMQMQLIRFALIATVLLSSLLRTVTYPCLINGAKSVPFKALIKIDFLCYYQPSRGLFALWAFRIFRLWLKVSRQQKRNKNRVLSSSGILALFRFFQSFIQLNEGFKYKLLQLLYVFIFPNKCKARKQMREAYECV